MPEKMYYVNAQHTNRPPRCYGTERDLVDQGLNPMSDDYTGFALDHAMIMYDSDDQWKRQAGREIIERAGLQDCGSIKLDMQERPRVTIFSDGITLCIMRPDTYDEEEVAVLSDDDDPQATAGYMYQGEDWSYEAPRGKLYKL